MSSRAALILLPAVLLRPLSYPEQSRLFVVYHSRAGGNDRARLSAENFLDVINSWIAWGREQGYDV